MQTLSQDQLQAFAAVARAGSFTRAAATLHLSQPALSRRIARHFGTMDAIIAATVDDWQQVDGIGAGRAASIVAEIAEIRPLIDRLAARGVNMTEPGSPASQTSAGEAVLPLRRSDWKRAFACRWGPLRTLTTCALALALLRLTALACVNLAGTTSPSDAASMTEEVLRPSRRSLLSLRAR